MKIGEFIEEIRTLEHERQMLIKERGSILSQRFEDAVKIGSNATPSETHQAHEEFLKLTTNRIKELNSQIDDIVEKVVTGRVRINRRNTELGVSEKLTRVKHLRMELSVLDKLINGDRYDRIDHEIVRIAGMRDRLKTLEKAKRALENEIKGSNYSNDM
jgi:hypothetical protein